MILGIAERTRDEQAKEIVGLEAENIKLETELEVANKELEEQDEIIYRKDETIEDLQRQLTTQQEQELQKIVIGDIEKILTPQPRILPMNDRDKQIIEQASAHLEPLTNATTLRNRIL